ncbi:MAG: SGNH/GDSL hydrolase family protein, partial [Lentimonas sp.]
PRYVVLCLLCIAMAMLPAGATQTDIVLFGDSIINGSGRLAQPLLQNFQETERVSGAGFCSFVDSTGPSDPGMIYIRPTTGWTEVDQSSSAIGLNDSHLESSIVGATISFSVRSDVDEIEIYFLKQPGGGSFRLYDGTTGFVTLSTNAPYTASDVYRIRWTPDSLPRTFQLVLHEAGTAGVKIGGVNFKTDDDGVRIHKIGNGGLTAAQSVSVDRAIWVAALRDLDPEIFCVLLGANDSIRNVSPVAYKADIAELVDRAKAASPNVKILLMSPPDHGYDNCDYELSAYRDALIALCQEQDLRFIDFKEVLGDFDTADVLGFYSDLVHPSDAGGQVMADAWCSLIEEVDSSELQLVDVFDESALPSVSQLSVVGVEGEDVELSWRRLPGIDYILCRSQNLMSWDEVPISDGYPQREFIYELNEEGNHFFKLKMSYPEAW